MMDVISDGVFWLFGERMVKERRLALLIEESLIIIDRAFICLELLKF